MYRVSDQKNHFTVSKPGEVLSVTVNCDPIDPSNAKRLAKEICSGLNMKSQAARIALATWPELHTEISKLQGMMRSKSAVPSKCKLSLEVIHFCIHRAAADQTDETIDAFQVDGRRAVIFRNGEFWKTTEEFGVQTSGM